MEGNQVVGFTEKPLGDGGAVNGGFFVLTSSCLNNIKGDRSSWEAESLPEIANEGELRAFEHKGFWQPMDTLRDKNHLESLWNSGKAPWKTWK
jgi:glucose-1-phosphate cytidylyltransferase